MVSIVFTRTAWGRGGAGVIQERLPQLGVDWNRLRVDLGTFLERLWFVG